MGNVIIEVAEGWGREQKIEEIAHKMLLIDMDAPDIIEATEISPERLRIACRKFILRLNHNNGGKK